MSGRSGHADSAPVGRGATDSAPVGRGATDSAPVGRDPGAGADRLPLPRGEFGPLDLLSDWAHAHYTDGDSAAALEACDRDLPLVEAFGDRRTARYLRYTRCLVHEIRGEWSQLRRCTQALLDDVERDADAGPYWRAKLLGLHAQALIHQDSPASATAALAEAYALVRDNPGAAYNRGSACHVVSAPLYSALLFEPAVELLRTVQRMHRYSGVGRVYAAVRESMVLGSWGLLLELLGLDVQADARYSACASAAVRARRASDGEGVASAVPRAEALLQFAYQRLHCEPVDERMLQAEALTGPAWVTLLPRMALVSVWARRGETAGAEALLRQVRVDARQFGDLVVEWVSAAWQAELQEVAHGPTESTRRWRDLALATLERLWHDREGRFEHLRARQGTTELQVRLVNDHTLLWQDTLTGVGNRRMLDDLLAVPGLSSRPVAFVDIDRFKAINDDFGHDIGDEVLRWVASLLRSVTRAGDAVTRYGGDEFVVVLAENGDERLLAERITAAVRAHDWDGLAPGLRVEVTVGAAGAGPGALRRADDALLERRRADGALLERRRADGALLERRRAEDALLERRRAEEGAGPADAVREGESSGEPVPGRSGRAAHSEAG